jgi:hypothetical protein
VLCAQVVVDARAGVGQHRRDRVETEVQLSVDEDLPQPVKITRGIATMPRAGSPTRAQQADLVVMAKGAHRHPRVGGYLADRVSVVGHATTVQTHAT